MGRAARRALASPSSQSRYVAYTYVLQEWQPILTVRGPWSGQTVTFLERLLAVKDAAASALLTLGDGNWRMGEGKLKDELLPENGEPSLGGGSIDSAGARCLPTSGMLIEEARRGSFGERGMNRESFSWVEIELKSGC